MLSRRILRIKVMQALYAWFQSGDERVDRAERNMLKSLEAIYQLYIHQLDFLCELTDFASGMIDIGKNKFLPTEEEKNPNTRFVDNRLITILKNNPDFLRLREALKIQWADHNELVRKTFNDIKNSEPYRTYMAGEARELAEDASFYTSIYHEFIAENNDLMTLYEEKNMEWANDYDIVSLMMIRTFELIRQKGEGFVKLPALFESPEGNDEKEEKRFVTDLFRQTIVHQERSDALISSKAENWELERIALMDMILLRMALSEFTAFPSIPVKVTINEYIELSKMYSTPRSKVFINGLLDKLLADLRAKDMIKKTGRGLIG